MRTHGPRMNRERTREVLDKLAIHVIKSNAHGVEIHRSVTRRIVDPGVGTEREQKGAERWRVLTGGGIAGNSDQVWLRLIGVRQPDQARVPTRGPFWNKTQLEKALRAWRRGA